MNKIFCSWSKIENAVNDISNQIKESGYQIDVIYGVPRGGLIVAILLSHKLNKPLILDPLTAKDKRILVVDDISDTGTTLIALYDKINPLQFGYRPITVTIHYKPGSKFVPDIYHEETNDWIVYPWETEETSKADYTEKQEYCKYTGDKGSHDEILRICKQNNRLCINSYPCAFFIVYNREIF